MTILHVSDFHFNQRWFDWLCHDAPPHDLLVMSGDMLDLTVATPHRRQIEWVSDWLNAYPRPIMLCSGNHDLEWDSETDRWTPAYWLRRIDNPNVWTDGRHLAWAGLSFLTIGATTRPKGGAADVWVVHAAPSGTAVTTRANGSDGGDPDLLTAVRRYAPRLVLSGHVHDPMDWREERDGTLFLNPGRDADAPFPNHILIQTDVLAAERVTARDGIESAFAGAPELVTADSTPVVV